MILNLITISPNKRVSEATMDLISFSVGLLQNRIFDVIHRCNTLSKRKDALFRYSLS